MKKLTLPMNILILSALLIGGCRVNDPVANPALNTDYSIIDGDTIKTVVFKDYKKLKDKDPNGKNYIVVGDTIVLYKEPKLHTPPSKDPDLSKLKNNDDPDLKGKPLRYVAIGGSLTAGVRDGGYFNEGILTSYPNLIARQMKLKKFEQPLFDATDYNGFGRKVRTSFNPTGGPVQKLVNVKNNEAIESYTEVEVNKGKVLDVKLKKYKNFKNIDNWGIPYITTGEFGQRPGINIGSSSSNAMSPAYVYHKRLLSEENVIDSDYNFVTKLSNNKFDFVTIELCLDNYLQGFGGIPMPDGVNGFWKLLDIVKVRKIKGVIANVPNPIYFPYFYQISSNALKKGLSTNTVYFESTNDGFNTKVFKMEDFNIPKPNSLMDSLASPKVHIAFKKGMNEYLPIPKGNMLVNTMFDGAIQSDNELFIKLTKESGLALVDLNGLYKQIFSGKYLTDEGILVENKMNGNFFSADGITPTSFGHAIIANEFIKVINRQYTMEIPLIKTSEYLEKR